MFVRRFSSGSVALSLAVCCLIQPQSCTLTAPPAAPAAAPCPHIPSAPPGKPPKAPISEEPLALQPGHWQWDDGNYHWVAPEWQVSQAGAPRHWRDGFWEPNGGACVWHNGRFEPGPAPTASTRGDTATSCQAQVMKPLLRAI